MAKQSMMRTLLGVVTLAAEEATLSRIFAGVHFRFDLTSGHRLGREVAQFVLENFLTRLDQDENSGE